MTKEWETASLALSAISVSSNPNNEPVTIYGSSPDLKCIGVGTDAAVFQSLTAPSYAFKVYAEEKLDKIKAEEHVYSILGSSPFFSTCYASTEKYLVMTYEDGPTFFDCLLQGITIPEQAIQDVETARSYVREKGLNPRDIHLKNILLQNGRAKILDVSEYIHPGNDFRWEHLKRAYDEYYQYISDTPMPYWLLETIRKWYHQWAKYYPSFEEFMGTVFKQTNYWKKP
ncbi:serine/threonine protein kinase [Planococcus sp. N028]|uniref:Serine/threonine protein kinase n=1 Tax=Planococcus shixiaomingii TaxID=3058393 RepID=A0ABT8MZY9_9BACL|nr:MULTISPECIES: serine/threonine protein kinase [unclassified Planococcus (in: firmicutes)]MDN7241188.1 serine/threonine protein kinase [Planococcus sp. N028]WKA53457.1 serine/threonine protein kinase [Planococcus sp. N022]